MLFLLLCACSSDEKIPADGDGTDATVAAADGDADGVLPPLDCDDADATVHPGADEVWYDGVDQDCDGGDDDQDGDGVLVADDCDDTDPAAYPGAGEVPDDGVDQDCDGVDSISGGDTTRDEADQDGDGWASEAYGGPDCDDGDAAIHPEAAEVAGDDLDSDCDGADFGVDALAAGDLVLTEIMYDPDAVSDSDGEWFEVTNTTGHSVNLLGLVVSDDAGYAAADVFTVETDLVAAPGDRLVFAVSGVVQLNGGIDADYDYAGGGVNLNNGGDDLYLGVVSGSSHVTIDHVTYDETLGWPLAKGASIELNDTMLSNTSNDSAASWCMATATAGDTTDRGSPGEASSGC